MEHSGVLLQVFVLDAPAHGGRVHVNHVRDIQKRHGNQGTLADEKVFLPLEDGAGNF